ncbi:helix-turn-helix domain-containing protein [Candidatus Gracilibacteria bacterium]|nr:helix-turn-helix domain-containing protein [Candidatus Gracilibacteria bacterium]
MYNITREEASLKLNLSTRSIDRYIKSGKLRSKKDGKIVYIHQDDIDNFLGLGEKKQVIIEDKINLMENQTINEKSLSNNKNNDFGVIFDKLKFEIKIKDDEIKELNKQIGKMEEVVKNSISLIEFKKNQFLLEESKNSLTSDVSNLKKEIEYSEKKLKEEKKLTLILIITTIILFLGLVIVFLVKI